MSMTICWAGAVTSWSLAIKPLSPTRNSLKCTPLANNLLVLCCVMSLTGQLVCCGFLFVIFSVVKKVKTKGEITP